MPLGDIDNFSKISDVATLSGRLALPIALRHPSHSVTSAVRPPHFGANVDWEAYGVKIGILRAIAHNVADSLGSGMGLLIGVYHMNVFGEATRSPRGVIGIDFLAGKATRGTVSPALQAAIAKYRKSLPALCEKHGATVEDFKTLSARYSVDTFNRRIIVTVRDREGRCYVDEYIGTPARHVKVSDRLGRIRTKRGRARKLKVVSRQSG